MAVRSYPEIKKQFDEGWKWDLPNAAKFKLIEFLKWEDLPEDYRKSVMAQMKKSWDSRDEDDGEDEFSRMGIAADEFSEDVCKKLWGEESKLEEPPIIYDIIAEFRVCERIKNNMFQAAMFRMHRIYALFWVLNRFPLDDFGNHMTKGEYNECVVYIKRWLTSLMGKEFRG